jgi:hypothetical protein
MGLNSPKALILLGTLKSFKHAIVVFYNPDDAERARNRYHFPPTAATPEITLRAPRGAHTALVPVQLCGPPPDRFYDVDSDDESAIFFHLRPPVAERSFLISPPDAHLWAGNRRPTSHPTRYPSLKTSIARSNSCASGTNRRTGTGRSREAFLAMSENEDGILLVPATEAGACLRVQNWCHCRRVVVARGSEGWDALDEELSLCKWELPSHVAPIRIAGSIEACTWRWVDISSGTIRVQPTRDPHLRHELEVDRISFTHTTRRHWLSLGVGVGA